MYRNPSPDRASPCPPPLRHARRSRSLPRVRPLNALQIRVSGLWRAVMQHSIWRTAYVCTGAHRTDKLPHLLWVQPHGLLVAVTRVLCPTPPLPPPQAHPSPAPPARWPADGSLSWAPSWRSTVSHTLACLHACLASSPWWSPWWRCCPPPGLCACARVWCGVRPAFVPFGSTAHVSTPSVPPALPCPACPSSSCCAAVAWGIGANDVANGEQGRGCRVPGPRLAMLLADGVAAQ